MPSEASVALFIGRFQPFHRGHLHLVRAIREEFPQLVLGIGSAQFSHTTRNPFTAGERYEMILRTLEHEALNRVHILAIPDVGVHTQWVAHVQATVPAFDVVFSHEPLTTRLFQEAGVPVREKPLLDRVRYSGTEIRRRMLAGEDWTDLVPPPVAAVIKAVDGVERIRAVSASEERQEKHQRAEGQGGRQ